MSRFKHGIADHRILKYINLDQKYVTYSHIYSPYKYSCHFVNLFTVHVLLQVKIADMHVRGMLESMLPGDPQCSPTAAVVAEALTALIRTLHRSDTWNASVNTVILSRLQHVNKLTSLMSSTESKPIAGISQGPRECNVKNDESSNSLLIGDLDCTLMKNKDPGNCNYICIIVTLRC